MDDEIELIRRIGEAFAPLDLDARERVLDYLIDRYVLQPRREAPRTE